MKIQQKPGKGAWEMDEMKQTQKPLEMEKEIQWLQIENEFLQKSRERWIFVTILSTITAFTSAIVNVIS